MALIDRVKNIIVSPKTEWEVIASETPDVGKIITGYVLPLAAAPTIILLLMGLIFGGVFGLAGGLFAGLLILLGGIASVFIGALFLNLFASSFNSRKDFGRSVQLVAYAFTPAWVAAIVSFIPILGWLLVVAGGFYALYLLYLGLGPVMETPEDKKIVYLIVTIVAEFFIGGFFVFIVSLILGLILALIFPGGWHSTQSMP